MSFASPLWLIGLLPWTLLVAWLLTGRRDEARVPFVQLWPRSAAPLRVRRQVYLPPVSIACLLVALLLAVVAAARPRVTRDPRGNQRGVTLVVDLYLTSPVRGALKLDLQPARVVFVRGDASEEVEPSNWRQRVGKLSSTPTLPALRAAVADALARDARPILVLSNQRLDLTSDRIVQIVSDTPMRNVGIVRVAARAEPAGQVMVTLRNQSPQTRAELVVSSDASPQRQTIDLPPPGGERSYFVDVPTVGRIVSVSVELDDDIDADNRAWLVRRATWPNVEARGELPPELVRVIDAYRKLRPPDEGSKRVTVAVAVAVADAGDEPAAVIAGEGAEQMTEGPLQVSDHPVPANVEWNEALGPMRVSEPPAGDWTPVVRSGARVLVAVRERPARQVWVGFQSDAWPLRSSFVVFWTNVFDWLGQGGGDAFVADVVQRPASEWQRLDDLSGAPASVAVEPAPGIWGRADGELRALNAIDIKLDPPPIPVDWRARLAGLQPTRSLEAANLARPALVAALALALIASLTWASVKRAPAAA